MANIERTGSARILQGTAGVLEITVYSDGALTDPTLASAAAVDQTGTVVAIGAAAITGGASGKVTATIDDAQTGTPKRLTVTWTLTVGANSQTFTTYHDVVGDLLFTEAELRAFDGGAVSSTSTYLDAALAAMHDMVAEAFEQVCGAAFGLRAARDIVDGSGGSELWLDRMQVAAVSAAATRESGSQTWTALTASELLDLLVSPHGRIVRESLGTWPSGRRNVRLDYTHGYQPIPFEVRRAAMWVARNWLTGSNLPRNALSQVDELGTFRLAVPGERGSWFGIPEVDRVLRDYRNRNRVPAVG